jgi:hypothetical protein
MQIPKPTERDKDRFRALIPTTASVEVKPMFGNLGAFVNGHMFAGLFGSSIGVRLLDPASRAELTAIEGTGPFGPSERPMGGYVSLPPTWSTSPERAEPWIAAALSQVGALPPKAPKKTAKKPR